MGAQTAVSREHTVLASPLGELTLVRDGGQTTTYGALARALGSEVTAQQAGAAVGRNPLCILIPCHRVVGADGRLTGYAGGLTRKRALLELERENTARTA